MGNSRPTQNIQINKVIGENEKYIFILQKKTKWTFGATQYHFVSFTLMSIVGLAVVIFLSDNLREKRSVPLTNQ